MRTANNNKRAPAEASMRSWQLGNVARYPPGLIFGKHIENQ